MKQHIKNLIYLYFKDVNDRVKLMNIVEDKHIDSFVLEDLFRFFTENYEKINSNK